MTYPQPSSNAPSTNGVDFFRLNTPLVSPGDVYQSEQGAHAFALGPESDLANIEIDYFDPSASPTFMNSVVLSPARSFVGEVQAANNQTYQPSNVQGRVLIRTIDLYNPLNPLSSIIGHATDESIYIAPQLDVIEYFSSLPSVVPARRDKEFYYQRLLQNNAHNTVAVAMPYYGRKSGSWFFQNNNAQAVQFGLFGINYKMNANGGYVIQTLQAAGAVASLAQVKGVVKESANGMFDAIVAWVDFTGVLTRGPIGLDIDLRIDVSDAQL